VSIILFLSHKYFQSPRLNSLRSVIEKIIFLSPFLLKPSNYLLREMEKAALVVLAVTITVAYADVKVPKPDPSRAFIPHKEDMEKTKLPKQPGEIYVQEKFPTVADFCVEYYPCLLDSKGGRKERHPNEGKAWTCFMEKTKVDAREDQSEALRWIGEVCCDEKPFNPGCKDDAYKTWTWTLVEKSK